LSAEPIYSLSGVQKRYGGRLALDIERLEIRAGEILGLVGPSGAGKSTLLRLLNFLESAEAGSLEYLGRAASPSLPVPLRREVSMVFQRPALLRGSVEQNARLGLRLRGLDDPQGRVAETLRLLGLESLRRVPAHTLSGGEAQRVALARAILVRPRVLLLDEPAANLDPYNVGLIERVICEINRQEGTTVVLVTHNIFQARRMAQRTGLLLNGRLVELAGTADFFERAQDDRTRAFVNGEMVY
jgi:tungstate transport system ATP-binding protein